MAKYDEQFKLGIVQQYLDEQSGYKTVANQHGLSHGMVRRWVKWFEAYGADAFKKKFTHYSAEFKLSALQHVWDNALSYGQVAIQFDIRSPGALGMWERSYRMGGLDALRSRPKGRAKAMAGSIKKPEQPSDPGPRSHDELLAELDYLRMENAYLKKLQALVQTRLQQAPPKKRK